ncbi:mechanosensitive ion channel family protein [Sunxiuqinia sp. A32]|uniref:mechanosensitive ion channel family protein n=1 Tax=Sunxiuqinia sp. A32 TaxID=3461496 RepID=UPI0040454651
MDILIKTGITIGGILFGILLGYLIVSYLKRLVRNRYPGKVWIKFVGLVSTPLIFLFIVIASTVFYPLTQFGEDLLIDMNIFATIFINISISWLIINAIRGIKIIVLDKYDLGSKDNLKARKIHTQLLVLERILITIILILAFAITLMAFPGIRKVGMSLLASAGIAGLIIGFAAQKSISLFLAGFQIAITQPIRLDDVVIVEGEWGWIEEITLTYVVVRIWDKRRLIVPVNYFIEKPFQNWTRTSAEILGTVFVYVDYGFPIDKMRTELTNILNRTDKWDGKVNVLQVTNTTDKTMEVRALVSSADSPSAWDLRVFVREELIRFIQEKYPQYLPKSRVLIPDEKQ